LIKQNSDVITFMKGKGTYNEIRADVHLHDDVVVLSQGWGCFWAPNRCYCFCCDIIAIKEPYLPRVLAEVSVEE